MHVIGAKFPFSLPHIQLWMPHVAWQKVRFRDKQQGTRFVAIFLKSSQLFKSTANWKVQKCMCLCLLPGLHISLSSQDALSHMASPVRPPPLSEAFSPPSSSLLAITVTVKKIWQAWQVSPPWPRNGATVSLQLQKPISDCFHWFSFHERY